MSICHGVKNCPLALELTLEEERCGGVRLCPGFFGHAVTHRNQDVLFGGRDRWVRRGWIRLFGWSIRVHFGTHDSVLVLHSGALEHKRSLQRCLCRSTRWRFHHFVFLFSQNLQKHLHRTNLDVISWLNLTNNRGCGVTSRRRSSYFLFNLIFRNCSKKEGMKKCNYCN